MVPEKDQVNTRFEFCIGESRKRFPVVAEFEFIHTLVNEEKLENIMEIINNIKSQFVLRIQTADWIDNETKETVAKKIENLEYILGYRKLDFNEKLLDKYLSVSGLDFTSNNIINMIREKNVNAFSQQFISPDKSPIHFLRHKLFRTIEDTKAGYLEGANKLVIQAGLLQHNIYSEERPNYLNYGIFGSIIGHEIAHSFTDDAYAHDYGEKGIKAWHNEFIQDRKELDSSNLTDLWQNDTLFGLLRRYNCVVEDYEQFNKGADGEKVRAENFADLIGVDVAYEAYIKWAEENEEAALPSLRYTPSSYFGYSLE
ncbi:hypothetical protein NQ317_011827, partial [Molorchus minor]